jgi:hypothetical protein
MITQRQWDLKHVVLCVEVLLSMSFEDLWWQYQYSSHGRETAEDIHLPGMEYVISAIPGRKKRLGSY